MANIAKILDYATRAGLSEIYVLCGSRIVSQKRKNFSFMEFVNGSPISDRIVFRNANKVLVPTGSILILYRYKMCKELPDVKHRVNRLRNSGVTIIMVPDKLPKIDRVAPQIGGANIVSRVVNSAKVCDDFLNISY